MVAQGIQPLLESKLLLVISYCKVAISWRKRQLHLTISERVKSMVLIAEENFIGLGADIFHEDSIVTGKGVDNKELILEAVDSIIVAYGQLQLPADAERVLEYAVSHNILPSLKGWNTLIAAYGKAEHQFPNYEAVFQSIEMILNLMKYKNVSPDAVTFATLIITYTRAGRVETALEKYKYALQLAEQEGENFLMSQITYDVLINGLLKHRKEKANESSKFKHQTDGFEDGFEEARLHALTSLQRSENNVNGEIIESVFIRMCQSCHVEGDVENCLETYNSLVVEEFEPTISMSNALFSAFNVSVTSTSIDKAMALFQKLTSSKSKVSPNYETYLLLISMWARSSRVYGPDRAEELTQLMKTVNIEPQLEIYELLLHSVSRSTRPNVGRACEKVYRELLNDGIHPSLSCYHAMLFSWSSR